MIVGRRDAPFLDAFVYQGGTSIPTCPLYSAAVTTLPAGCTPRFFTFTFPGAYQTAARGISDGGDVAGWTIDVGLGGGHGYLRLASAQLIQIDAVDPVTNTSYADFTQVLGMNNLRQLVGEVYTQAAWDSTPGPANFNGDGTRAFIATPAAASMPVPAQGCAASSGGCDLSNGTIPHTVSGGPNPLPGTVTESTCAVVPDPRLAQYGTCTGHTLPVAQVCPGFGTTVIPDTLCGGAGPAQNGFVLVDSTAEGVDALSGILVDSEAFADKALGSSPPCPVAVGAWAPRSGSSVEGTIPESPDMVELTGGCGSSKTVSRGLSIYGVGLTLNTAALPGDSLPEKLKIFTAEKYGNLYKTIAEGNMTLAERIKVNACAAISEGLFIFNKTACAAHTIVQCDAQVAANVGNFSSSPSDPNVYGDIRGRLANLYLTINTRILGNEPNTTWPVALSQAPACH